MALVDQPIPNLYGGVSQQPPQARFINQLTAMTNCSADPVEGLKKRPPTEHVRRIIDEVYAEGAAVFPVDRDPDNRYVAVVRSGRVQVFDVNDGTEKTVLNATNSYLDTPTPATSFRALTIADYTFLVNRDVTIQKAPDVSASRPFEGIVFVRAGNYGKDYSITIRNEAGTVLDTATYTTPRGDDPSHIDSIDTAHIASSLYTGIAGVGIQKKLVGSGKRQAHSGRRASQGAIQAAPKEAVNLQVSDVNNVYRLQLSRPRDSIEEVDEPALLWDDPRTAATWRTL